MNDMSVLQSKGTKRTSVSMRKSIEDGQMIETGQPGTSSINESPG